MGLDKADDRIGKFARFGIMRVMDGGIEQDQLFILTP